MNESRKYLDPLVLSKLGNMDLVARCAVEGLFSGLHPSPFHGFSVEYSDHRAYQPGDELKFLDWRMYGRSDKLYIKQFKQETNVFVYILLDSSNSMSFSGSGSVSKLDYGSYLAAALAYLMLGQGDSVGLTLFAEQINAHLPPRSRRTHLNTILTALGHNKPRGRTRLEAVLHTVAEMNHRRGLVILISDLLEDNGDVYKGLAHLKYLSHDVIVFHTLDHEEVNLDYRGLIEFTDLETKERIRTFPESLQNAYRGRVRAFIDEIAATAGKNEIDYCLLNTSETLDKGLMAYLAKRKQLM
jgi:uncharacterized protein (DUF58 family)